MGPHALWLYFCPQRLRWYQAGCVWDTMHVWQFTGLQRAHHGGTHGLLTWRDISLAATGLHFRAISSKPSQAIPPAPAAVTAKGAAAESSNSQSRLGVLPGACRSHPEVSLTCSEPFAELAATFLSVLYEASPCFTTRAPTPSVTQMSSPQLQIFRFNQ